MFFGIRRDYIPGAQKVSDPNEHGDLIITRTGLAFSTGCTASSGKHSFRTSTSDDLTVRSCVVCGEIKRGESRDG